MHLGDVFLTLDLFAFAAVVYVAGAETSWLFVVFLVRPADQVNTSQDRVLFFTTAAVGAYLFMLAVVVLIDGRPVDWPTEFAKTMLLLGVGLYFSYTARTAQAIRLRTGEVVSIAQIGRAHV